MIVAVDGPAASGKGTIARAIARRYGLPHLDTGLLYRAVGVTVLRDGGDPADPAAAVRACAFKSALLDDVALKSEDAGRAASLASAHPPVRAALLERQRGFARQPGGAVLDGRDIGTVIAPDARPKLFVTAHPEVRAQRRFAELTGLGLAVDHDEILADILARDERDCGRGVAPLRQAEDAVLLDTSDLDVAQSVARAIAVVARAMAG